MKKYISEISYKGLKVEYPHECEVSNWFYRYEEISNNYWRIEFCNSYGQKVSRDGLHFDELLQACILDIKQLLK